MSTSVGLSQSGTVGNRPACAGREHELVALDAHARRPCRRLGLAQCTEQDEESPCVWWTGLPATTGDAASLAYSDGWATTPRCSPTVTPQAVTRAAPRDGDRTAD